MSHAFANTKDILEEVETIVASSANSRVPIFRALKRETFITGRFLFNGVVETIDVYFRWVLGTTVVLVLLATVIANLNLASSAIPPYFYLAALYLPIPFSLFALPSTYGYGKTRYEDIQATLKVFDAHEVYSLTRIKFIRQTAKPFEEKARARIRALKWFKQLGTDHGLIEGCL